MLMLMLTLALGGQGEEVTADELQQILTENPFVNVFDVRTEEEYLTGALPGADNMPLSKVQETLQSILEGGFNRMDTPIYLYGKTPEEGNRAEEVFRSAGFTQVKHLASLDEWRGALVDPARLLGDMVTQDIYGQPVDDSIIAEKKLVMVNMWATFCNPCIGEMADLGRLANDIAEKGVQMLGLVADCSKEDLSADERQTDLARTIVEATEAAYPHLLPNAVMYRNVLSQVQTVPTTFFLDGRGRLVGQVYMGARSYDDWKQIVEETLASLPQ